MRAAYYETNGAAREVLHVGEVETPKPGRGEVRVRLAVSGVNPSDVKIRAGLTRKIAFPRVIPHSDGAGEIDQVGEGVSPSRVGERVWVWNGQWRRPFGTAATSIVLPSEQAVPLPASIGMEAAACLGIPAYTAYQAVLLTGIEDGSTDRRGRGRRRSLRHPVREEAQSHRHHYRQLAGQGRDRAAGGRRPCDRLQARGRRRAR